MINGAEEYSDAPEDTRKVFTVCERCNDVIYEGEEYYDWLGVHYCEDCFRDAAFDLLLEAGAERRKAGSD